MLLLSSIPIAITTTITFPLPQLITINNEHPPRIQIGLPCDIAVALPDATTRAADGRAVRFGMGTATEPLNTAGTNVPEAARALSSRRSPNKKVRTASKLLKHEAHSLSRQRPLRT